MLNAFITVLIAKLYKAVHHHLCTSRKQVGSRYSIESSGGLQWKRVHDYLKKYSINTDDNHRLGPPFTNMV